MVYVVSPKMKERVTIQDILTTAENLERALDRLEYCRLSEAEVQRIHSALTESLLTIEEIEQHLKEL